MVGKPTDWIFASGRVMQCCVLTVRAVACHCGGEADGLDFCQWSRDAVLGKASSLGCVAHSAVLGKPTDWIFASGGAVQCFSTVHAGTVVGKPADWIFCLRWRKVLGKASSLGCGHTVLCWVKPRDWIFSLSWRDAVVHAATVVGKPAEWISSAGTS